MTEGNGTSATFLWRTLVGALMTALVAAAAAGFSFAITITQRLTTLERDWNAMGKADQDQWDEINRQAEVDRDVAKRLVTVESEFRAMQDTDRRQSGEIVRTDERLDRLNRELREMERVMDRDRDHDLVKPDPGPIRRGRD